MNSEKGQPLREALKVIKYTVEECRLDMFKDIDASHHLGWYGGS